MEKDAVTKHKDLALAIEQSVLKPAATAEDVRVACRAAAAHGFYGVCVNPIHTATARAQADVLSMDTERAIKVITVVAFPLGSAAPAAKVYEAMKAAQDGADELDIVMAIPLAMAGDWRGVERDLSAVIAATPRLVHKVIIETAYLKGPEEMEQATLAALRAGAAFIKTSTGYSPRGASVDDILALKKIIGGRAGIKAAGAIRTAQQALELMEAGAARLGTSSGVQILEEISCRGKVE